MTGGLEANTEKMMHASTMIARSKHTPRIALEKALADTLRRFSGKSGKRYRRNRGIYIQLKKPAVYAEKHDEAQYPYEQTADQSYCPERNALKESAVLDCGYDLRWQHRGRRRAETG